MRTTRAYATLTLKSVDSAQRVVSGIASTPTADSMADVVEPKGAQFALPLPLLWQHKSDQPIGHVTAAQVSPEGIAITAQIAKSDTPGALKDRLDLAWESIKLGLVKGLSIGFKAIEESFNQQTGGYHILQWQWYELSAVTIPANGECHITAIKAADLAASGPHPIPSLSGASDPSRVVSMTRSDTRMKKSYSEQITAWEATRQTKTDRMDALLDASAEKGVTFDAAEQEEHDTLKADVDGIDAQITRLKAADEREKKSAKPVDGTTPEKAAESRSTSRIIVSEKALAPGIGFARYTMCVAASKGSTSDAIMLAKQFYPDDSRLEAAIRVKAAIGAGAALTSHWADDLVPYNILADDFITFLRAGNVVDKFGTANPGGGMYPSLRRVPFNVRVSGFNAGLTGNWVQEGLPAPLSKATSFNTTLTWAKVEGIVVLTQEEVRFSNPSAEAKVRDDLAKAINARIDIDFVDPAKGATANVSPASITNAIVAKAPAGATAANLITDLAALIKPFATNFIDTSQLVLIMSASQALQISMMTTTLGMTYFPNITMQGGSLRGIPVMTSEQLAGVGSPSLNSIVAVAANEVYLADDGVISVDASNEASLEMLDGSLVQTAIVGTGASLVSLWQNGLLGIKAQREITWKLRRTTAVQYISPAAYAA